MNYPNNMIKEFKNMLIADTFLKRFCGLMFRKEMGEDEAIIFPKASAIHTCFMRFSIDIIFADKDMRVIKIFENIKPWRVVFCPRAAYAIECLGGKSSKKSIYPGARVSLQLQ